MYNKGMLTTETAFKQAEEGIQKAATTAGSTWVSEATEFLKELLTKNPSFFCDDIWEAGLERGDQPKALGQVIRNAAKEGWIEEIRHENGIVARPSKSSNNQLKRVWKSNLYKGDVPVPSFTHPKREEVEGGQLELDLEIGDPVEEAQLSSNSIKVIGSICGGLIFLWAVYSVLK